MGQYYKPCFIGLAGEGQTREVLKWAHPDDYDNGLKLMEHSYAGNNFVALICAELFYTDKPQRLVWAGDYADKEPDSRTLYSQCEYSPKITRPAPDYKRSLFRYLVNHDKKAFVHLNHQPKGAFGLQLSPLPLLTAEGNGQGGGDYEGTDMEFVGSWAGDLIQVVLNKTRIPKEYKEIIPVFKESYR